MSIDGRQWVSAIACIRTADLDTGKAWHLFTQAARYVMDNCTTMGVR